MTYSNAEELLHRIRSNDRTFIEELTNIIEKIVHKYAKMSVHEKKKKNIILNELIVGIKPIKVFSVFLYFDSLSAMR